MFPGGNIGLVQKQAENSTIRAPAIIGWTKGRKEASTNLGKPEQAIREASDQQGQETPRGQEMRAGGYTSEEAAQEAGYAV